jgi:hypothetical protein
MTALLLPALLALASPADASLEARVDEALAAAGLTVATARFDPNLLRFYRRAEFTLPLFEALNESPWRTPWIMETKRRELAGQPGQPHQQLAAMGPWMGWAVRRTLISDPLAPLEGRSIEDVLGAMRERGLVESPPPSLDGVPDQVRRAVALILGAILRAEEFRRAAMTEMGDPEATYEALAASNPFATPASTERALSLMRAFKPNVMAAGAHDLFLAVARAEAMLRDVPPERRYRFEIATGMGGITLFGGDGAPMAGPILLAVNTGGDNRYRLDPEHASLGTAFSVVLDTHGDDAYLSGEFDRPLAESASRRPRDRRPGVAGALLGVSVVWDARGDDLYRSHAPGLGSGRFGFALLHDGAGDDLYDAYADSQGFGMFGGGILEDLAGDDRYFGFYQVQGAGQTGGFGLLLDRAGDDRYVAHPDVLDFPSAQDAKTNVSMAQGAGNGRRADFLDGNSLAGGIGVLFDAAGDDAYRGGVFCQGVGYWEGVGALWDGGGNDAYDGVWYAMGASAHFAVGYLEDLAGDDAYNATHNMALGAGHDFGIGILIDRAGDDRYRGPNLSFGAGNANGLGWFADLAGNDSYESSGLTLGAAADAPPGTLRERALTLGLFMDLGGVDRFPETAPWARPGATEVRWTRRNRLPQESHVGVFWGLR